MENCNGTFPKPRRKHSETNLLFLETFGNAPKQSGKRRFLFSRHPKHAGKDHVMRSRLLALGLFSVAAVHPVFAAQPEPGA
ncbi:MAG: hypothetical protein EOS66_32780, partial [Mesorhizobium sp.]